MMTALMNDRRGDIRVAFPIGGQLRAPRFNFSEAIGNAERAVAQCHHVTRHLDRLRQRSMGLRSTRANGFDVQVNMAGQEDHPRRSCSLVSTLQEQQGGVVRQSVVRYDNVSLLERQGCLTGCGGDPYRGTGVDEDALQEVPRVSIVIHYEDTDAGTRRGTTGIHGGVMARWRRRWLGYPGCWRRCPASAWTVPHSRFGSTGLRR
jgi:hypothetical protein